MNSLALNIRQGGGTRIDSIYSYLIAQDCDALVISEFRRNIPGDQLIEALRQAGFSHIHHNNTDSKQNTVMLAQSQWLNYLETTRVRKKSSQPDHHL